MGVVCPLLALNGTITHRPLVCLMFVAQMNPCLFCVSPRTWTNVCHCRLTSESLTATWRSYSSAVRPSTSRSVDALVELRWSVCVFLIIMLDRKKLDFYLTSGYQIKAKSLFCLVTNLSMKPPVVFLRARRPVSVSSGFVASSVCVCVAMMLWFLTWEFKALRCHLQSTVNVFSIFGQNCNLCWLLVLSFRPVLSRRSVLGSWRRTSSWTSWERWGPGTVTWQIYNFLPQGNV